MFYVNPKAIASLYDEIFEFGQSAPARRPRRARPRAAAPGPTSHLPPPPLTSDLPLFPRAGTEAMYCFTGSMRPFVSGPFADESIRFFDKQG